MKKSVKFLILFVTIAVISTIIIANNMSSAFSFNTSANSSNVNVGDTITVTANFGEAISMFQFSAEYNPDVLEYVDGSISAGSANDASGQVYCAYGSTDPSPISRVSLKFRAKAIGESTVRFDPSSLLFVKDNGESYNGENIGGNTTVTVNVTEAPTDKSDTTPQEEPTQEVPTQEVPTQEVPTQTVVPSDNDDQPSNQGSGNNGGAATNNGGTTNNGTTNSGTTTKKSGTSTKTGSATTKKSSSSTTSNGAISKTGESKAETIMILAVAVLIVAAIVLGKKSKIVK